MSTYITKNTHPGTAPFATIYMGGLLCLSFDGVNRCTVGVNKVDVDHNWRFTIVEVGTSPYIVDLFEGDISSNSEIKIEVTAGTTGGTYVYNDAKVSLPGTEKRFDLEHSWVDLEGSRGHNTRVLNDANTVYQLGSLKGTKEPVLKRPGESGFTDRAPCMSVTLGQTSAFTP